MGHEGKYEAFNDMIIRNAERPKRKTVTDIQNEAGIRFWSGVNLKLEEFSNRNMFLIRKLKKVRVFKKFMNKHKWTDNEAIYNSLRMELSKDKLEKNVVKYLLNKIIC